MELRQKIYTGALQLLSLSLFSTVLRFLALIVVVSVLGIEEYGKYAGGVTLFLVIEKFLKMEIKILLVQYEHASDSRIYDSAFSVLVSLSLVLGVIVSLVAFILLSNTIKYQDFSNILLLLIPLILISTTTEIPRAILERNGDFSLISKQEFTSSMLNHSVTIPLIFLMGSNTALILGFWIYNLSIAIMSWYSCSYLPKYNFDKESLKKIFKHGIHLSIQNGSTEVKKLINPLFIGYYFGPTGVGLISFAEKIIQGLRFYQTALHRVAASMLGSVKTEGMEVLTFIRKVNYYQILPLGLITLLGSFVIYSISELTMKEEWIWLNYLYPFLATGFIFSTLFTVPTIAMQMYFGMSKLSVFQVISTLIFFISCYVFVSHYGLIGYGLAELTTIPVYYFIVQAIRKNVGSILTDDIIIFIICICIALHWYYIHYISLISLLGLFLVPRLWQSYLGLRLGFKD